MNIPSMNIVYLVFGNNLDHYQQVYFSIYTAFAYKNPEDKIIVIAEDASLFNSFEDKIEVIPINRKIITEWEGSINFSGGLKLKRWN